MLKNLKRLPLCILIGAMSLHALPALADHDDRGERHERRDDGRDDHRHDRREDARDERRDDRHEERREERFEERRGPPRVGGYFADHERVAVYEYYGRPRAHCPPGLAKRGDRCMPARARMWQMGRPLPRGMVYQPVEAEVSVQLGAPPAGHQFVRVAGDILLIAVGTAMVVDAIQDIQGR
jgi:Ni/Co efflux regulator RcnB